MKKYWGDEEKSREVKDSDGWLHSGDLGKFDEDGYLQLVGRSKDMIIRGGENIYPIEIEDFLHSHPDIFDIHVIGVNDEVMGEEVCAWVKLKDGATLTAAELKGYCKGKIAHFKLPRYYKFVEVFPMTVTGKVRKNDMRHITNELIKLGEVEENDVVDLKTKKKKE